MSTWTWWPFRRFHQGRVVTANSMGQLGFVSGHQSLLSMGQLGAVSGHQSLLSMGQLGAVSGHQSLLSMGQLGAVSGLQSLLSMGQLGAVSGHQSLLSASYGLDWGRSVITWIPAWLIKTAYRAGMRGWTFLLSLSMARRTITVYGTRREWNWCGQCRFLSRDLWLLPYMERARQVSRDSGTCFVGCG